MKGAGRLRLATLASDDGTSVSLGWTPRDARQRLGSRQRPNALDEWVYVHCRICCQRGAWDFIDACLTESEADDLVRWLDHRPWRANQVLSFMEHSLSFTAAGMNGGLLILRARFIGEAAPPWLQGDGDAVWREGWTVELAVPEHRLAMFCGTLRSMLVTSASE